MKVYRKGQQVPVIIAVLALAALLGACGVDQPGGSVTATGGAVQTVGTPTAGLNTCTSCHSTQTNAWLATRHGNLESDPSFTTSAFCAGCHDRTRDAVTLSPPRMVVACEACHSGGKMHADAGGAGPIGMTTFTADTIGGVTSSLYVSGQFRTCSTCHQLLLASDPAGTTPAAAMHSSTAGSVRVITDTHFARYMTSFGTNSLSGYALNYGAPTACTDCHAPHGTADINREWQKSAHADIYGADAGYNRAAWTRSNWSCNATSTAGNCGTTSYSDRGFCQRCHTTEGFIAFADALRAGNTARANAIRQGDLYFTYAAGTYTPLASVVTYTTAGWKPQMLTCNACHTDYKGTLRDPGPFTANYDYYAASKLVTGPVISLFVQGLNQQYPDVSGSNICVTCHSGRESGETIKALNSIASLSTFTFDNKAYFTPHELTGAGTVFGATGYEYAGRAYGDDPFYRHKDIGTAKEPGTGSNGPCVGCHMSRPNKGGNHLFMPVTRAYIDPAGPFVSKQSATITGIASEVCFRCHGPNDNVILDMVREQKLLYAEAIEAVAQVAEGSGYFWNEGSYLQRDGTTLRSGAGAAVVTNGSTTVAMAPIINSTFGNWVNADIEPGDQFRFDSTGTWYTILSVDTGTQLTLTAPYAGATATGRYTVQKAETVSVANGGTLVTGVSASWTRTGVTANASAGSADHFRVNNDGTWYQITARSGNTLTLATPYAGPTVAGAAYTIRRARASANAVVNWLTPPDADAKGNGTGKNNMGASFNIYILESDPAGYVHNRYYMKRLMYDTIDWLDDNILNYSTGATLHATCNANPTLAWCPNGMNYILPNGVIPGGVPAERP